MNHQKEFYFAILCVLLLAPAGWTQQPVTAPTPAIRPTPSGSATAVADGDWPGYNRTLSGERFSPLNQITTKNVASLKQVCIADLGETGNYQSGIVMVNNTLYVDDRDEHLCH